MTSTLTPEDALHKLLRIARGESRESFMSIPARPNEDADLVLAAALREREQALEEIDRLKAELESASADRAVFEARYRQREDAIVDARVRAEAAERERDAAESRVRQLEVALGGLLKQATQAWMSERMTPEPIRAAEAALAPEKPEGTP